MAQETYRIEIPIEVTDKTNPGVTNAQKNLNGFDKSVQQTDKHLQEMDESSKENTESLVALAAAAAVIGAAMKKLYDILSDCTDASIEFESAMVGVSKTTDMTDSQLASFADDVQNLSEIIPKTTTELGGIAEVAGQLGIADENVLSFTETMANLATATTMTADEAATLLAQFANITQMDPSNYENLASSIVDLGNNYATTEQKITQMSQGMAASASLAGMSEADIVGFAAAVTSLGIESEAGSSSMSKLISNLMTAVETGDGLEEFASTANMSAEEFTSAWGENAAGALQSFISGLNDTERNGASATVILKDLGLTEVRLQRMILSLANSGDLLTNTIGTANDAWTENTALQVEAEKRYATTESQLILMGNAVNNVEVAIGDALTPTMSELAGESKDVLSDLAEFIEANPELVQAITVFVGILSVAAVGLIGYAAAAKVAATASALFTASIPAIGPIMLVVGAIAAMAAVSIVVKGNTADTRDEMDSLTATSREQYNELQDLKAQYDETCEAMGDTSAEAQLLKKKVDDSTEAFEENRQTAEELTTEYETVMQAHEDLINSYEDSMDGIDKENASTVALTKKLEDLMDTEGKTAETKQEILAVVDLLNEALPELGLAYDSYSDSMNTTADAIRNVIEAEIAKERNEANYSALKSLISEEDTVYSTWQKQAEETKNAAAELETAKAALVEAQGIYSGQDAVYLLNYQDAVENAQEAVDLSTQSEKDANDAYDENLQKQKELLSALGDYADASEAAEDATDSAGEAIVEAKKKVELLTTAYEAAYKAAKTSVEGQFDLWDKVGKTTSTSSNDTLKAIQSQVDYWSKYDENLDKLGDKEIPGMDKLLGSLADGSTDSAATIAGMAGASDDQLTKMAEAYAKLQEAQGNTATDMAALETNFDTSMENIIKTLSDSVSNMDLSAAATTSAQLTIAAYLNEWTASTPGAYAAGASIAQAAISGMNATSFPELTVPPVTAHAFGGIESAPHMGLVAEDGPESIIPLSSGKRDRGLSLWEQTGEILGVRAYADGGVPAEETADYSVTTKGNSGGGVTVKVDVSAAPVFQISGVQGADSESKILKVMQSHIKEMVDDIGDELAVSLTKIFTNMPIVEGA